MRIFLYFSLLLLLLAVGCGPVESTSMQWQVEKSLRHAEKLGAERLAPYEITMARRYYQKAKEEAGYADFEQSIDYFHKARTHAKQAAEKAEAASKLRPGPEAATPATKAP